MALNQVNCILTINLSQYRQFSFFDQSYMLDIQKEIYNVVGWIPKRKNVSVYKEQNISVSTFCKTIKKCKKGIPCSSLPKSGKPRILKHARKQRLVEPARSRIGVSQ